MSTAWGYVPFPDAIRYAIEAALSCTVYNHYGMTEMGLGGGGYHGAEELGAFVVHSSPSYPDIEMKISGGFYHVEQRYCRQAVFGVSSRDFSAGPVKLGPGDGTLLEEIP